MTDQPTLITARLILRPFRAPDAPAVQRLAGDPQVADTTMNIPHPYPDGLAESWIAAHPSAWAQRTAVTFAITAPDESLRGAIGLRLGMKHRHAELGYWIGRAWWGQGLATEAAAIVLSFAFETLDLHRVHAHHLTRNPASGKVMQKIGMKFEGVLREHILSGGVMEDIAAYGILRREWRARRSA